MAKLQRKTQKIFSANSATNEHAVFGTMKNIVNNEQPQYSMDVEVLQSGTAFLLGWQNAVVTGFAPFLEELNGLLYVITSQLAYILNNGLPEYDANTTYYKGDVVKVLNNGVPVFKYSLTDDNLGNSVNDTTYWKDLITDVPIATTQTPGIVQPDGQTITIDNNGVISASGSSRNIGEIVASTLPLVDAGLHLLDGALIQGSGIYADFVSYIAGLYTSNPNANYFTTESNWQSSVSSYGVCGKFVYNSTNNTVRLPKITGKIDGTTDVTALGDLEPLFVRLPNITGNVYSGAVGSGQNSGAFYDNGGYNNGGGGDYRVIAGFDASRSSSVYSGNGTNTAIHEQAIKYFVYIVIATSTKTEIEVDIDEIATDLNGKADVDLSNVPVSKGILTESYVNGTSWYRVYSDGWCEQGGYVTGTNNTAITTTFLKQFVSIPNVAVNFGWDNVPMNTNALYTYIGARNITTQNFIITVATAAPLGTSWIACGYIR